MPSTELQGSVKRLEVFGQRYQPFFDRREQREHGARYLQGLLSSLQRKSIEPIALEREDNVRCLQHFIGTGRWQDEPILREHQKHVTETLGEEGAVLVVDGKGFPKQGEHSVGVKRQWCGRLGKTANCQVGEFLGYVSSQGHTLIDRRLYLPEDWARDPVRRRKCHVPEDVEFRTGWELALEMIEGAQVPYEWITGDERYGDIPEFKDRLDEQGRRYVLEVPRNTRYWVQAPQFLKRPRTLGRPPIRPPLRKNSPGSMAAEDAVGLLAKGGWKRIRIRGGEKGPMEIEAIAGRVWCSRNRAPDREMWLVIARTLENEPEYKYFESNGSERVSLCNLLRVAYSRWPIEQCFEQTNQETGLAHYETRSWAGWHHHITLTMLAHHFLVTEKIRLGEKTARDDRGRSGPHLEGISVEESSPDRRSAPAA
jgi:SRSO17 transposase